MSEDGGGEVLFARFPRRLLALCVDLSLFVGWTFIVLLGVEMVPIQNIWTVFVGLSIAGFFLYEPLLVSITGGTIGHHALNLRVARDDSQGNLRFFQAFIRMWLKGFLGIISFFFMGLTRKHQALHDLATHSSVQIKRPEDARPAHYVVERTTLPGEVDVSRFRRVLMILVWGFASFVAMSLATIPVLSDACALNDLCTDGEELALAAINLVWFLCLGAILVFGWRGQLPGARATRPTAEDRIDA